MLIKNYLLYKITQKIFLNLYKNVKKFFDMNLLIVAKIYFCYKIKILIFNIAKNNSLKFIFNDIL